MSQEERFEILEGEKIDINVYYYLKSLFNDLNIEILGRYEGTIFDLMRTGKLEGWCWQTTETAALFMPDDATVYRGDLHFTKYKKYYHSFIEFDFEGYKYVFDPCLSLINKSDLYFNTFDIDIKGKVSAKKIREYFIKYINDPPKKEDYFSKETIDAINRFLRNNFGSDYLDRKDKEIVVNDIEDPSAPMYRNGSGYKNINIDNNKVKSLTVHYYYNF